MISKKGRRMQFGGRLRDAMTAAGFSEQDVPKIAKRLGVSRQIVKKWLMSPVANLSAIHLVALAKLLSVRAHWLATGEGPMVRLHASTYSEKELLKTFRALSKREQVLLRDALGLILKFSQED